MIKISSATQKDLICLCGLCDHEAWDEKCLYFKVCDSRNPSEELHKRILALMRKEILANTKTKAKTTNGQKTKRK